jgi:ATP-binding cassette, subfamily C (CFTR/MRP), member 1
VILIIAAIFWTKGSGSFGVSEAFTTLSIAVLVTEPLALIIALYAQIVAALACFGRIQAFLLLEEREEYREFVERVKKDRQLSIGNGREHNHEKTLESLDAGFRHAAQSEYDMGSWLVDARNATWASKDKTDLLRNINYRVPRRSISMLVGRVGCGKSSLLKGILGELDLISGSVCLQSSSLAYCDQTPWLRNISVRANITDQEPWDEAWYARVTKACALEEDFDGFPDGDATLVGTGGIALSGGQRQRVVSSRSRPTSAARYGN